MHLHRKLINLVRGLSQYIFNKYYISIESIAVTLKVITVIHTKEMLFIILASITAIILLFHCLNFVSEQVMVTKSRTYFELNIDVNKATLLR